MVAASWNADLVDVVSRFESMVTTKGFAALGVASLLTLWLRMQVADLAQPQWLSRADLIGIIAIALYNLFWLHSTTPDVEILM